MRFCCASGFEGTSSGPPAGADQPSGCWDVQGTRLRWPSFKTVFRKEFHSRSYFQFFFRLPFALSRRYM
jgi:hypothetical protein